MAPYTTVSDQSQHAHAHTHTRSSLSGQWLDGSVPTYVRPSLTAQKQLCEYCLIAESDTFYGCEVDHIISLKHGGSSELHNLAYACAACNRAKGSDVGSISTAGDFTRFFNPRTDRWSEHFLLEGAAIHSRTPIGEVTARIFGFNESARIHEREEMMRFGIYPGTAASAQLTR